MLQALCLNNLLLAQIAANDDLSHEPNDELMANSRTRNLGKVCSCHALMLLL